MWRAGVTVGTDITAAHVISWPFCKVEIDDSSIIVYGPVPYRFLKEQVTVKVIRTLPVGFRGFQLKHAIQNYPKYVVFVVWPTNTKSVISVMESAGISVENV